MKNSNKLSRLSNPKEFKKAFDKMIAELEAEFGYSIRDFYKKKGELKKRQQLIM